MRQDTAPWWRQAEADLKTAELILQVGQLHDLFYEVGGNAPLDLICLTPEEFESAKGRVTLVREVLPEAIDLLAEEPASA